MVIRVQTLGDQRIQQRAIPVTPTSGAAPQGAFGEGVEEVTQEGQRIAQGINKVADEQLQKANNLWFMNAENQLAAKQLEIESNAKQQKGRDAFDLHNTSKKEFDDFAGTIKTNNNAQKIGLQSIKSQRGNSLNRTITGHVDNQYEVVETQESESLRFNLKNSAAEHYENPVRLAEDKKKHDAGVADEAARQGLGSEATKAFTLQENSSFHVGVIQKMLSQEDNAHAREYFKDQADEMTAVAKQKLLPAIQEGGLRADAQNMTDEIMNRNIPEDFVGPVEQETWDERFAEARKIKDPELRDRVTKRLKDEFNLEKSLEREAAENVMDDSIISIENNPGVPFNQLIDPVDWNVLTLPQKRALEARQADLNPSNPKNITTDFKVFTQFSDMSTTALASLTAPQFYAKFRKHMDDATYKKALNDWQAAKAEKEGTATPEQKRLLTDKQLVSSAIEGYGIREKGTTKDKIKNMKAAIYERIAFKKIEAITDAKEGKPLTKKEINDVLIESYFDMKNTSFIEEDLISDDVVSLLDFDSDLDNPRVPWASITDLEERNLLFQEVTDHRARLGGQKLSPTEVRRLVERLYAERLLGRSEEAAKVLEGK